MARLTRARIVERAWGERILFGGAEPSEKSVKRVASAELDARREATRIVDEAQHAAEFIIEEARTKAADVSRAAAREAAAAEQAKLAAQLMALRSREQAADGAGLDRSVELARMLAERLVGEALAVDPTTVAKLARQALAEAQGARTVRIEAHPDDVGALQEHLSLLGTVPVASVTADATIERGCLRLRTDLGTIDANLTLQLDRLARALRDALR